MFKKIITTMGRFFWQMPQNYIGLIMSIASKKCMSYTCNDGKEVQVYFNNGMFGSGVSLGDYIIFDTIYLDHEEVWKESINHEHGHQKQSMYLGPLYLIIIGFPSFLGNIIFRIFNIESKKYYKQPWEAWADKLGGVVREN